MPQHVLTATPLFANGRPLGPCAWVGEAVGAEAAAAVGARLRAGAGAVGVLASSTRSMLSRSTTALPRRITTMTTALVLRLQLLLGLPGAPLCLITQSSSSPAVGRRCFPSSWCGGVTH
jgi:hypothetical protein